MLPRGLTTRIALAFAGLAVALMFVSGAALSVVLYDLHDTTDRDNLSRDVIQYVVNFVTKPKTTWDAYLRVAAAPIADEGGFVIAQNPNGAILTIVGSPSSVSDAAEAGRRGQDFHRHAHDQ